MTIEFRALRRGGAVVLCETVIRELPAREGKRPGLAVVMKACETDRKLHEQLVRADKLAAVGTLVSGVAHAVNNPLTGALGRVDLLLRGGPGDDLAGDLQVIRAEIMRAVRTLQNLLSFARNHKPEKTLASMNDVIGRVLEMRQYELRVRNVDVGTDFQEDLPRIMIDTHQLEQVVLNLVINAQQAMAEANDRGTLSITTRHVGDKVRAIIQDDGPGIPYEHLNKVFDPFFTTKWSGQGTGLGLSICHAIVQEHSGAIHVESQAGDGATFILELPVTPLDSPQIL